jgi:hypothetical protein
MGRKHVNHLSCILEEHYKCSQDWTGAQYLDMDIDWDYATKKVHISMLDYVPEALIHFQHQKPCKPQHQPYPRVKPTYGTTKRFVKTSDTSPPLNKVGKNTFKKS